MLVEGALSELAAMWASDMGGRRSWLCIISEITNLRTVWKYCEIRPILSRAACSVVMLLVGVMLGDMKVNPCSVTLLGNLGFLCRKQTLGNACFLSA